MMLVRDPDEALADGAACLEAALHYLARGWCPIPLCPPDHVGAGKGHGKRCDHPGKAPLIAEWTSFAKLPTEDRVREWWRHWPTANVGIVMGRVSGMVGLDVDGEAGEQELLTILAEIGLPSTLEFRTSGGGRRLLFGVEAERAVRIAIRSHGKKQEIRLLADGAQTVAPPSRHASGDYYRWELTTA